MIIDQLFTRPLFEQAPMASPEQLAYNKLRAQYDGYQAMTSGDGNTAVSRDPAHAAKLATVPAELARMAAALKAKGIDAEAQYDALSGPAAAPVDANQAYGGISEAADPKRDKAERMIWKYFGQIYDYGDDDGLNYLDEQGDLWNQLMDKYNGEIDDIVAQEPIEVLMQAAQELKVIADEMEFDLDEAGVTEGEYDSRKPFGVRYKVFAGREGRMTTREYWTSSEEKLQRAVDKIQALDNFYEIDGYSYPKESQGVAEGSVDQLPTQGADYSKHDTDHLKMMLRPGILHRNEARFKALIRKELQKREQQSQQGVAEGLFGIDDKIKGRIQNVVSDLSDIPGMWDHKAQTFTDAGMDKLKTVLKNNPKYIKYALNLNYRDYEAEGVAEGSVDQLPTQGADYSKHDTDHLKMMLRPGILHRNEARFKALIRKELQKREQQSQQGVAEGSESAIQKIEKKIQAKRDALGLAREQRRARGQHQQGQQEIKIQAEIDRLSNELTQLKKQGVAEGKHFKTAYGWAGGSKPGGGTYKHPDQIKADREAKKKAKEQEQQKNKQPDVGVAEAEKKQVKDRKTGQWYDPDEKFKELQKNPDYIAQMKRMGREEGKGWPKRKEQGVAEGSEQKPAITYKDYTLQYDYQTEDDDPEGYSTATTYYFDVLKDGDRVGEAEYFDYFGNLTIRINGKTKEFGFRHPLASQISQLVSSLPDEQKKDLSDPRFESQDLTEVFADQGSGSTDRDNADYMKRRNAAKKADYTGRETKAGTWRVFKDGNAVAAAGPFKSADQAAAWIKKHKQGITEMDKSEPSAGRDGSPRPGPDREAKPISAKKATRDAGRMLNRAFQDSHKKKDVKETQEIYSTVPFELARTAPGIQMAKMAGQSAVAAVKNKFDDLRVKNPKAWDKAMQVGGSRTHGGAELPSDAGLLMGDRAEWMKKVKSAPSEWDDTTGSIGMDPQMKSPFPPLMKKLQAAMVQEGRVKELADDLKTLNDAEFMKKYGKVKAAIRRDMKQLDEATPAMPAAPAAPAKPVPQSNRQYAKTYNAATKQWTTNAPAANPMGNDPAQRAQNLQAAQAQAAQPDADEYNFDSWEQDGNMAVPLKNGVRQGNLFAMPVSQLPPGTKIVPRYTTYQQDGNSAYPVDANGGIQQLAKIPLSQVPKGAKIVQMPNPGGNLYKDLPGAQPAGAPVNELSTNQLARYKTAAAKDAKRADQAGDFKRGDRRLSGMVQATKKQFDNDAKKVDESRAARRALMARIVNSK